MDCIFGWLASRALRWYPTWLCTGELTESYEGFIILDIGWNGKVDDHHMRLPAAVQFVCTRFGRSNRLQFVVDCLFGCLCGCCVIECEYIWWTVHVVVFFCCEVLVPNYVIIITDNCPMRSLYLAPIIPRGSNVHGHCLHCMHWIEWANKSFQCMCRLRSRL